jgi:hypothetical protein
MAPRSDRPARLLIVTPIYPTPDRPEAGAFVWRRVAALREVGVDVRSEEDLGSTVRP